MTNISCVHYEKHGPVAYITLNRPHVLNAMNLQMHSELSIIWDDFEQDEHILVGVLGGAGDKAFSVGQDLKELAEQQNAETDAIMSFGSRGKIGWPRLTERFERTKPLIAKVQGYALGGGFELALACDIIVATHNATFALPEVKLGLIAGAGGVFRLVKQLPFRTALGYLLTGRTMTAAKALELGLINNVVSNSELDACVSDWVQDITSCAPLSVRAIQQAASQSAALSIEQAFITQYPFEELRKKSLDAREGPKAFIEKRSPIWKGR